MTVVPFHPDALRLLAIADLGLLGVPPDLDRVRAALRGGVTMLQLRGKDVAARGLLEAAGMLLPLCAAAGIPLLVNDRPDVARAAGAAGVHVGPQDLPPREARGVLGPGILGVSARDATRVRAAEVAGADYLGMGAFRGTPTKPEADVLGPAGVVALARSTGIPAVAIGGLRPGDAAFLRRGGLAGMAVLGGIFAAGDPEAAARAYRDAWDGA